jgi:hypothetical protein
MSSFSQTRTNSAALSSAIATLKHVNAANQHHRLVIGEGATPDLNDCAMDCHARITALLRHRQRRFDIAGKEGVPAPGPRLEFRVELTRHKPGMSGQLNDFDQLTIERPATHLHARFFQLRDIVAVHLVTMPMPLRDLLGAINGLRSVPAPARQG